MDITIKINNKTREATLNTKLLGIKGENNVNKIFFSFSDSFIDGSAWLEIEQDESKKCINLEKNDDTYVLDVLTALVSVSGIIRMQLHITKDDRKSSPVVFKSVIFTMNVKEAIDVTNVIEENYPEWIDIANTKLSEFEVAAKGVQNLDIQVEKTQSKTVYL